MTPGLAMTEKTNQVLEGMVDGGFGYGFATFQNPSWTLDQVLLATGGRLANGHVHASFRSICTDSRAVRPGDLFLALKGETFDGAVFAAQAIGKGAAGIMVEEAPQKNYPTPTIVVNDSLAALGDLAAYRRALMTDLCVLALTGSSGKTTAKEMLAAILTRRGKVLKTKGNFNNLVGLPLSLLPVSYRHDFAVLEMGMNAPGEIARLTEIADPNIACILNVQGAHLQGLGSIDGVARAKGEIFENARQDCILVYNYDDRRVKKLVKNYKNPKVSFGFRKGAEVRATRIHHLGTSGQRFTLHVGEQSCRVTLPAIGRHNVQNGLAAAAMAYAANVNMAGIQAGLEKFAIVEKRLQIHSLAEGVVVVDDCYNANPASMLAALATVTSLRKGDGKVVAVLGDMLELGPASEEEHHNLGKAAAEKRVDAIYCVGEYAAITAAAARKAGMHEGAVVCGENKEVVAAAVSRKIHSGEFGPGSVILVKASRGMRMETIVNDLLHG